MANRIMLNETSYHGAGAIQEIATEAKARAYKKAFVCSDPDLIKFGVTKKVTDVLDNGTAAEVTINYVITDVEKKRKFVCVDPHDMPVIAVVDPDMMSSMPKGLTAATGMDALTHAIEGYSRNRTLHGSYSGRCIRHTARRCLRDDASDRYGIQCGLYRRKIP